MNKNSKSPNYPPQTWLQGPTGVRVLPKYEQQKDGTWKMSNPEAAQQLLNLRNLKDSGGE